MAGLLYALAWIGGVFWAFIFYPSNPRDEVPLWQLAFAFSPIIVAMVALLFTWFLSLWDWANGGYKEPNS